MIWPIESEINFDVFFYLVMCGKIGAWTAHQQHLLGDNDHVK